eukprot:7533395-Karenia_brevis.AAC.1
MALTYKCPLGHSMSNVVDEDMNYQCGKCSGHVEAKGLHMCCEISGCMHRMCMECVSTEVAKHAAKKRSTVSGGLDITTSPARPGGAGHEIHSPRAAIPDNGCSSSARLMYQLGEQVEYHSVSKDSWMPATVIGWDPQKGTFNLNCKPDVPSQRIRRPPGSSFQAPNVAAASDVPKTFDLQGFAASLKPFMREACEEAVGLKLQELDA